MRTYTCKELRESTLEKLKSELLQQTVQVELTDGDSFNDQVTEVIPAAQFKPIPIGLSFSQKGDFYFEKIDKVEKRISKLSIF